MVTAGKNNANGGAIDNVAIVLVPTIVKLPPELLADSEIVLYERLPPWNVLVEADVAVNTRDDELALKVNPVVVDIFHAVPVPVTVHVPPPIFKLRVPTPVPLKVPIETLLLLTLQSKIQPVVDAVHAPIVIDCHVGLYPEPIVAVQVVPPTHVAPSRTTASLEPGTLAPVPPVVVPQIVVSLAVMVQVVLHVRKRLAASASAQNSRSRNAVSHFTALAPI